MQLKLKACPACLHFLSWLHQLCCFSLCCATSDTLYFSTKHPNPVYNHPVLSKSICPFSSKSLERSLFVVCCLSRLILSSLLHPVLLESFAREKDHHFSLINNFLGITNTSLARAWNMSVCLLIIFKDNALEQREGGGRRRTPRDVPSSVLKPEEEHIWAC